MLILLTEIITSGPNRSTLVNLENVKRLYEHIFNDIGAATIVVFTDQREIYVKETLEQIKGVVTKESQTQTSFNRFEIMDMEE